VREFRSTERYAESHQQSHRNIDPHHGLLLLFRVLHINASQHRNPACHKRPTEWQLVAGDLTRTEAQMSCHHRDGSVQNAITYLCIRPSSHNCSKDAIRWNRAIETKPDVSPMPTLRYQGSPCESTMERLSEPNSQSTMIAAANAISERQSCWVWCPLMKGIVFLPRVLPSRPDPYRRDRKSKSQGFGVFMAVLATVASLRKSN
jgi:hypothetical protein